MLSSRRRSGSRAQSARLLGWLLGSLVALAAPGCSGSSGLEVGVALVTDYRPGVDFERFRTEVSTPDGTVEAEQFDEPVASGYREAKRIALFDGIGRGERAVTVELLDGGSEVVASRRVRARIEGPVIITVAITSDCADVGCPDGDPAATECVQGRCVPPECATGREPECPDVDCDADADCTAPVACAAPVCNDDGLCLSAPMDSRCGADEVCDLSEGCRSEAVMDASVPDAAVPDGDVPDAGPGPDGGECDPAACDDGIACTADDCDADGDCTHVPDDAACTAGAEGTCDPELGCQYATCTPESCTPEADCQTATCDGDSCVRESTCSDSETCCAGSCVPAGCDDGVACTMDVCGDSGCEHIPDDSLCDDGNPCTDDTCGTDGCTHTNNSASCDDGSFCNGPDTCEDGSCSVHSGDPCTGSSVCDESADACVGCTSDSDCPDDEIGSWSTCGGFSGTCDTTGTQSRDVTTYSCESSMCVANESTETRSCSRDTDGVTCGDTSCGDWGSCGGFDGPCDETGTQSRTCTDRLCSSGTCTDMDRTEEQSCTRDTDGETCASTSCGSCTYDDECDETATEECTEWTCSSGSCVDDTFTQTCDTRDTDGDTCTDDGLDCTSDLCSDGVCTHEDLCPTDSHCESGGCESDCPPCIVCPCE